MSNPTPSSPPRLGLWILVGVLAFMVIGLACWHRVLAAERDSLRTERQLAEVASRMAQNRLAERSLVAEKMINDLGKKLRQAEDLTRLRIAVLAPPADGTREMRGVVVWNSEQQAGLLRGEKLPLLTDLQDYQLWIVDPDLPDPVSGAVFQVDAGGQVTLAFKPDHPVAKAAAFRISVEQKGGVPKAVGPIILLGK